MKQAVAERASGEHINWTDELTTDFRSAQDALHHSKSIVIPRPSDPLIITCDGAVRNRGIGSILYVPRNGERRLAGFSH